MKKKWAISIFLILSIILINGCSSQNAKDDKSDEKTDTRIYESENGPVEVPKDPKRVVVLSTFAGNVMALDVNLVGVDSWSKMNPRFEEKLKDIEEVSEENLEKLLNWNQI